MCVARVYRSGLLRKQRAVELWQEFAELRCDDLHARQAALALYQKQWFAFWVEQAQVLQEWKTKAETPSCSPNNALARC